MFLQRLALFFALLFGVAAAQLPEYAQQYRQRLGGAIDELQAIIAQFDADAAAQGLTQPAAIKRLQTSPDPLVRGRGDQMEDIVARAQRLTRSADAFVRSGPILGYVTLAENFDPRIAARAYQAYQPGVPVTADGFISGGIGFLVGGALVHLLGWPVHRRMRLRKQRLQRV